jgi:hypothetical protein
MAILSCPMENGQTSKFFAGNIDGLAVRFYSFDRRQSPEPLACKIYEAAHFNSPPPC